VDAIINVIDATHLVQGLTLTIELLELGRPVVLAINMMDEAQRQGLKVDGEALSRLLGIPVLPMIASRGQGIREAFTETWRVARDSKVTPQPQYFSEEIEKSIADIYTNLAHGEYPVGRRALVVKLLEGDPEITIQMEKKHKGLTEKVHAHLDHLCDHSARQAVWLIATERQRLARELAKKVSKQGETHISLRDRLDDYLLHPFWGYVFLVGVLALFFSIVYGFGDLMVEPLIEFFDNITETVVNTIGTSNILAELVGGAVQGIAGGIAIVLPYLIPFLVGLGLLEDIGYLTRIAFLMDALMHRMGLHGKPSCRSSLATDVTCLL
jgi:ferrous iron transport protein B